jgi:large subunit ribosomal protein L22
MTGPKTNERPGTRATLRGYHMSASKARVVLNLIRNEDVNTAREILAGTTREAADVIGKVLASAVANAVNNDGLNAEELFVSAAYADEGITMKRFTPRARGRAGKIRKRACHITVIVSRLDEDRLEVLRSQRSAQATASRSRRVATSRRRADQTASLNKRETAAAEVAENEAREAEDRLDEELEIESFDNESGAIGASEDLASEESDATDVSETPDVDDTTDEELDETSKNDTVSEDTTEETN